MDWLQAIILGIVQGITEFLPVSSSGHLVLFQRLLGVEHHNLAFDVAAHVGTLLSVLTVYHKLIQRLAHKMWRFPFERKYSLEMHLVGLVVVASLPTAMMGLFLKDFFSGLFLNLQAVGLCFLLTGGLLLLTRGRGGNQDGFQLDSLQGLELISWQKALLLGFAQGLAIAPGVSRAGTTIAAGLLLGLPKSTAAMFSFMMAIPAILGAGLLELKDVEWSEGVGMSLLMGFAVSYFAGLFGLKTVLHFVRKGRLEYFTLYLWILGASVLVWTL